MPASLGTVTVSSGFTTVNGQIIPRGMQIWTVGTTGWYDVVAGGAGGGDALKATNPFYGGRGVVVKSRYFLTAGSRVVVLVGMKTSGCWATSPFEAGSFGSGGGSFVSQFAAGGAFSVAAQHTLILVAGGGGSAGQNAGLDGTTGTAGLKCRKNPATSVATNGGGGGGVSLNGGNAADGSGSTNSAGAGAGGGGFRGKGGDVDTSTTGGLSFLAGGRGGYLFGTTRSTTACVVSGIPSPGIQAPPGGFGGGAGAWNAGSGGGGYSGGQGCSAGAVLADRQGGGGGGSYDWSGAGNAGTLYSTWDTTVFGAAPPGYASGYMSGDGRVVISLLNCPSNTHPNRDFTACLANAGYYVGSSGVQFPPSPFMSGDTFTSGGETFTASASSFFLATTNEAAWRAFSGASTSGVTGTNVNAWTANTGFYSGSSSGAYTGTSSTTVDGAAIRGEWLQLQSTVQHTLGSFSIMASYGSPLRAPRSFVLAGSNDGVTWTTLQEVSGVASWTANQVRTYTMPEVLAVNYFRLIVTNTTGTSETYLTIDKLRLFDAQVTACAGTCASGTKFCLPDGASSVCCAANQYFIPGISTACTTCPANSAADTVYQERCVANTGFFGPSLYMFDGSQATYQNLGSKTSHTVTPFGWRPTFGTVVSRFGAYFDASVHGNYYRVSNDYNTITLAFWMYLSGTYGTGTFSQYDPLHLRTNLNPVSVVEPRGFNFALGPTASVGGTGYFYACYTPNTASSCLNAVTNAGVYPASAWKHVVLVLPSGSDRLQRQYVDGVKVKTAVGSPTSELTNFQTLVVGANDFDGRYYKGYLQQLTMYNYAMSDAEVTALYNSGTPNVFVPCAITCSVGLVRHCLTTGVTVCCPSGTFFRSEIDTTCQACPAGTYSGTSASSCALCLAGTYYTGTGASSSQTCTGCPVGTFATALGAASNGACSGCLAGTYSATTTSACTLCPAGTFSLNPSQILLSACVSCPAGSTSNATRTGCVANAGFYNLDSNLLAYYPFRPDSVYTDASWSGYGLTDMNALYKPQSDFISGPFSGAGTVLFNNPGVSFAGVTIPSATSNTFRVSVGTGLNLHSMIGTGVSPSAGFTLCFWMRGADGATTGVLNSINAQNVFTFMTASSSPTSRLRLITVASGNSVAMDNLVNSAAAGSSSYAGKYTRLWSHQCYSIQGTTFKAYFDCSTASCSSSDTTLSTSFSSSVLYTFVTIGQGGWDYAYYGWLSDVRYYKKALTPAEVFAVRSYAGATSFSVNGDPCLLAYYPFRQADIYADASGNGYTLTATNAGSPPVSDGSSAGPFTGAGVASLDNNNVLATASTARSFTITMGAGFNLGAMFGTQSAPNAGFSFCGWYKARNTNTVNQYQALISIMSHSYTTTPSNNILRYFSVYRDSVDTGMTTAVRFDDPAVKADSTLTTAGKYQNIWTHYCAAGFGRTVNVYYDCLSRTCTPAVLALSNDVNNSQYQFGYIGADYDPPWHGWLSEFRLYKRALTAAEVFVIRSYDGTSETALNSVNSGLLAYYPFHPNAFLLDASGVTGSLVPTGSPAFIPGSLTDLQNVAYFAQTGGLGNANAARQFFTIPQITIGPASSICFWYNPDSVTGQYSRLIDLNTGANSGHIDIRREVSTSNLAIEVWNGASSIVSQSGCTASAAGASAGCVYAGMFQLGVWQHMCLTITGTTGRVYYNGALQSPLLTLTAQKAVTTYTTSWMGQNPYSNELYRGQLDEVRIYSRAISASEVTSIYNFRGDTYTPAIILPCPNPCPAGNYGGCTSDGTATCTSCPAGTFSTGVGMVSSATCVSCGAGTYFAGGVCTNCPAGTYSGTTGASLSSVCTLCLAGTFSTAARATAVQTCTGCLAGTFSGTAGLGSASSCQNCPAGTYSGATGLTASTSCLNCPAGTYSGTTGLTAVTSCLNCAAGTYSGTSGLTAATSCLNCPAGTYSGTSGLTAATSCVNCPAGTYSGTTGLSAVTSCLNCPAGTYSGTSGLTAVTSCLNCPAGTYSGTSGLTASTSCLNCPAGTYSGTSGLTAATSCLNCPAGTYSGTSGLTASTSCLNCPAGRYSGTSGLTAATSCLNCPVGTYSGTSGLTAATSCLNCPAGTYSGTSGLTAATSCLNCPAGTYSGTSGLTALTSCQNCAAGTYSGTSGLTAATSCQNCPAGTFSGTSGLTAATSCQNCPTGKYSATTGSTTSTTCQDCATGTYTVTAGLTSATSCTACAAGTFSGTTGASSATNCQSCAAGSFSPSTGLSACTACIAGTYLVGTGGTSSSQCVQCLAGTFSGVAGAPSSLTCTACSAGKFSGTAGAQSSSACQACSNGFFSLASASACSACLAGTYGGGVGVSVCPACGTGQYTSMDGQITCSACPAGTYSTLQGASTSATCQACAAGSYAGTTGLSVCTSCAALGVTCPAGTTFRCSSSQAIGVCCGVNQYFRESLDTACQSCAVGTFSPNGGGSDCLSCLTSPVSVLYLNYSKVPAQEEPFTVPIEYDIPNYRVFAFDFAGYYSVVFPQQTYADFLLVGGGGAGSIPGKYSGGGGAGSVLFYPNAFLGAMEYQSMQVGFGGGTNPNSETGGITMINNRASNFGYSPIFVAGKGDGPGAWPDNQVKPGGGGGGACDTTNCLSQRAGGVVNSQVDMNWNVFPGSTGDSRFVLANAGGFGSRMNSGSEAVNNGLHGGGGGGAGAAGGNEVAWTAACSSSNQAACGRCGYGGDGVAGITIDQTFFNFSTFFGKAYTDRAEDGYIAGGGGGGGYSSYGVIRCKGGRGGGGAGYKSNSLANKGENGRPGTGSGGGGSNDVIGSGGKGGSGLLLIRVTTLCVCTAGSYSGKEGCMACPAGTFSTSTGLLSAAACSPCQAGTYSPAAGSTVSSTCLLCQAGTYQTGTGMQSSLACTACSAGYYATGTGFTLASNCVACAAGTFSATTGANLASVCLSCSAGKYSGTTGASSSQVCTACSAGYYATGTGFTAVSNCLACAAGTFSATTGASLASVCLSCSAGKYSGAPGAGSETFCLACNAGYYATGTGFTLAGNCLACSAGTYGLTIGLTICTSCAAGTYSTATAASVASTCISCSAGTYSGTTGASVASVCQACSAGRYSTVVAATIASTCQLCSAGTYFSGTGLAASGSCTACLAGLYSTASGAIIASTCQLCSAGTYFTGTGLQASAACTACSTGVYSTSSGAVTSSTCQSCLAGTFQSGTGLPTSAACTSCSAGLFSLTAASSCTACLPGTFSDTPGSTGCIGCNPGFYSTAFGLTTVNGCIACGAGTFSQITGASSSATCTPCFTGKYGGTGVTICTDCASGTFASSTGFSACAACSPGTYMLAVVGMSSSGSCLPCIPGTYSTNQGAVGIQTCQPCSAGTYSTVPAAASPQTCQACSAGTYSSGLGAFGVPGIQQVALEFQVLYPDYVPDPFLLGNGLSYAYVAKGATVRFYTLGDSRLSGLHLFNRLYNSAVFFLYNVDTSALEDIIPRSGSMTSAFQAAFNVSAGVTGTGTSILTWDTSNAPSGMYFLAPKLATTFYHLSVFVASASPTTIVYEPSLILNNYLYKTVVGACLGDTLELRKPVGGSKYTTLPIKDLFITCTDSNGVDMTVLVSGPPPLIWVVGGIPANMMCFVSYGSMTGEYEWYSMIKIFPRPSSPGSTASMASPCISCLPGTFSTASGAPSSSTCEACQSGTYMTQEGGTICTDCPSSSTTNATGKSLRGDCVCNAGFVGDLAILSQTCSTCPADSYCAGLSQTACPTNTRSPAQSSLPVHCRCVAGFKCSYRRDVTVFTRFNMDVPDFNAQASSIRSKLASVADVPVGNVTLVHVSQMLILNPGPAPSPGPAPGPSPSSNM